MNFNTESINIECFNPYFIGLPILICKNRFVDGTISKWFQSLFYWITYSYFNPGCSNASWESAGFNPYFIGLPILIISMMGMLVLPPLCFNPYFIGLPILIINSPLYKYIKRVFQSLFYWITYSYSLTSSSTKSFLENCFNPYFIGLPILI